MAEATRHTLGKRERVCSKKTLDALFSGQHKSISSFPLRAIYMHTAGRKDVSILTSVSKRHFKHAVDRNRVKRQLREAYRLNKHLLQPAGNGFVIAFLWGEGKLLPTADVMSKMRTILQRINETKTLPEPNL